MAILVLRNVKGSPLTNTEVDNNFSNLNSDIGVFTNLTTQTKANLVNAVNETQSNIGNVSILLTGTKANLVNAINEVRSNASNAATITTGTLSAARLPTSGVSAATYGGTTQIPVLVVDTTGRITSASNVTLTSGVSSVSGATGAVSNAQIVAGFSADRVPGTAGNVLTSVGGVWVSQALSGSGATILDVSGHNASTYYLGMANNQTSGSWTSAVISSTKLYFNPSTGTLNATVFNSLSDALVKEDIMPVSSAVDTVKKLTGVEFAWKDNGQKSAGVVAQDIEAVLPYLVNTSEHGMKSVNYNGLIAYLIQSIKELDSRLKKYEGK